MMARSILASFLSLGSLIAGILAAPIVQAQTSTSMTSKMAAQFEDRICGVNPNRTLFRNQKREEVVLFFVNHIPKNPKPLADVLAEFKTTLKTKSARTKEVKDFVNANYALTRHDDEVNATIGDRFIAKKLDWLGLEKAADEIGGDDIATYENELLKTATAVESQFKKDGMKAGDMKLYFQLQLGPVFYARWKNEKLRKTTRLVPLDDVTMRMKTRAYNEAKEEKATMLLKAVPGSGIRTSDMEQIIDISQVSLFSGVKERTPELLALMAKIKKPDVKKLVESYRVWIEQGVDSLAERDAVVAKTILAQKGMGLLVLSANFGAGLSEHLMNACPSGAKKK